MSGPKGKDQTWANLIRPDQEQTQQGPSAFEKATAALGEAGGFLAGFAAEQMHAAGQDFVTRVLELQGGHTPPAQAEHQEPQHEPQPDRDEGMER